MGGHMAIPQNVIQARTQLVDWGGAFKYIVDFNYPGMAA